LTTIFILFFKSKVLNKAMMLQFAKGKGNILVELNKIHDTGDGTN
jgi:hypothetical protein